MGGVLLACLFFPVVAAMADPDWDGPNDKHFRGSGTWNGNGGDLDPAGHDDGGWIDIIPEDPGMIIPGRLLAGGYRIWQGWSPASVTFYGSADAYRYEVTGGGGIVNFLGNTNITDFALGQDENATLNVGESGGAPVTMNVSTFFAGSREDGYTTRTSNIQNINVFGGSVLNITGDFLSKNNNGVSSHSTINIGGEGTINIFGMISLCEESYQTVIVNQTGSNIHLNNTGWKQNLIGHWPGTVEYYLTGGTLNGETDTTVHIGWHAQTTLDISGSGSANFYNLNVADDTSGDTRGHTNYVYVRPGGTLNVTNTLMLGRIANAELNILGGTVSANRIQLSGLGGTTGTININNGTLRIGSGGLTKGDGGAAANLTGATIFADGNFTWIPGIATTLAGWNTFHTNGNNITIDTTLSGTGNIRKEDAGTLTFTNNARDTRLRDLTVDAGTVVIEIGQEHSIFSGTVTVNYGAELQLARENAFGWWTNSPDVVKILGGKLSCTDTNGAITVCCPVTLESGTFFGDGVGHSQFGNFIFDNTITVLPDAGTPSVITGNRITFRSDAGYVGGRIDVESGGNLDIQADIRMNNISAISKHGDGTLTLSGGKYFGEHGTNLNVNLHEGSLRLNPAATYDDIRNIGGTMDLAGWDGINTYNNIASYVQDADGILRLEIHKNGVDDYDFDKLLVGGNFELSGSLELFLTGVMWTPEDIDFVSFDIFGAGLPTLVLGGLPVSAWTDGQMAPGMFWSYNAGLGVLELGRGQEEAATPEPAAWGMMLAGVLAGLACFRRKRGS